MQEPIAVWQTEFGWSAVIPGWQIDLEVRRDCSGSSIDANSVTEEDIRKWRRTVAGKVSPSEFAQMILMASRIPRRSSHRQYLLLLEDRVVEKEEFLERVARFAEAIARRELQAE